MMQIYSRNKTPENKLLILNEGGSRAGKTWDTFFFLIAFCDQNRNRGLEIYILRDTLTNCKDFTLKDFYGVLSACDLINEIKIFNPAKPDFNVWGNQIHFRGMDDEANAEGYPSDIIFINEILETRESKVNGLLMRCRLLFIADWNPKLTKHWIFKKEGQPNTFFTHTTYKNNKYLQKAVITTIESYNPDIPENVINGTADEFRWKVYGLGLRAANEATVFKKWESFKDFPTGYDLRVFGLDFGFTNDPTTLIELVINKKDLYCKEHLYQTGLLNSDLYAKIKDIVGQDHYVVADTNEPKSIIELQQMGLPIIDAVKGPDSRRYGIAKILQYNLFIHENSLNLRDEILNCRYMTDKNGNVLNIPIDKKDHCIDPIRYALTKFYL